ncbi:unnamed protein product [Lactuca saligna]|uniref:Uncharacterized protein n=1 Tax=Lactuca saligna TaxID=75948 RepID=A0AA35ZZC6_LACSI|nr:unnamed protein product [Lactuca saligna]
MEKFGIHLLMLFHVYLVPQFKSRCSKALIERLTIENVVDVLQLARLSNEPDLHLKCLEILQVIDESELKRRSVGKNKTCIFSVKGCGNSSNSILPSANYLLQPVKFHFADDSMDDIGLEDFMMAEQLSLVFTKEIVILLIE